MKLEVGMYVRNDNFGIGKINKDYFDSNNKRWFNVRFNCYEDEDCHCGICEESIGFKVSHNIMDLIYIGDYVNGEYADLFDCNYYKKHPERIKSVVTKEQFKRIMYKVS